MDKLSIWIFVYNYEITNIVYKPPFEHYGKQKYELQFDILLVFICFLFIYLFFETKILNKNIIKIKEDRFLTYFW
jgi:hypothetical protein